MTIDVSIIGAISEVTTDEWNALVDKDNPFACYEFLNALEQHDCVGQTYGWLPQHIIVRENGKLIGASPMYLKNNSYGEFVFDWAWADAYHRSGIEYYPKLVTSIPYTPATGQRFLIKDKQHHSEISQLIIHAGLQHAKAVGVSSVHWLFTNEKDTQELEAQNLMLRLGCQFHWQNKSYINFDHYLSFFNSKNRKKIKRERKQVQQQAIEIEIKTGHEMSDSLWKIFHDFYISTIDKKSGMATLTLEFFKSIGTSMPDSVLVLFAKHDEKYVASAFCIRGKNTLFGRHWGCNTKFNSLHFELCYYQGLEYCINNGLKRFEPGAQGEHKIYRGFLPTETWSAHWIAHPEFNTMIRKHVQHEREGMQYYIQDMHSHSPFK
ncbi:FIG110192: hypothetical protein [hydrothermal vent metagenome]|uniref:COGs COG3146 n=1 Tax=hydrothermal vent metagenome TaxID=652676 RepID=A0A3B1ATF7_9ZZZZ